VQHAERQLCGTARPTASNEKSTPSASSSRTCSCGERSIATMREAADLGADLAASPG
jgi:hypothetical protein